MTTSSTGRLFFVAAIAGLMTLSGCGGSAQGGNGEPLSEYALMLDSEGKRIFVPSGCSSAERPVIIDGQIPSQLTELEVSNAIGFHAWRVMGNVANQHQCWIANGDLVFYETRIGDVTTARGMALMENERVKDLDHTELTTAAPRNTLLEQYLNWRQSVGRLGDDLTSPVVAEARAWLERIRSDKGEPAENRAIAAYVFFDTFLYLARQAADGSDVDEVFKAVDRALAEANELGHPLAAFEVALRTGLPMELAAAVQGITGGQDVDLSGLSARFAEHGPTLHRAAELGSLNARSTLSGIENAGLVLQGSQLHLASLPTRRQVENALNARMRASYTTADVLFSGSIGLPAGHLITCDPNWCSLGGFGFYRFSYPSQLSCEGGDDRAVCDVTFRLIQRMDMGAMNNAMTDFANTLMSTVSRATPISATIALAREGQQWHLVGPITTR